MNFQYAKRIGTRSAKGPRPVVVKFHSFTHRTHVRKSAFRLKGLPYSIAEHYPLHIELERRKLYPIRKWARDRRRKVRLYRDKLFIDDMLFVPGQSHLDLLGLDF